MTAQTWLEILEDNIKKLPKADREGVISYYKEFIADGIENGENEEDFVATLGNPHDVAKRILEENGIKDSAKSVDLGEFYQNPPPIAKNGLPLWVKLLIGFFGVIVGIPVVISLMAGWLAVLVSVWACFVAFVASAFGCALGAIVSIALGVFGTVQNGWALFGGMLLGTGVCALLAVGFWQLAMLAGKFTKWLLTLGGKKNEDLR